jgi:hypothetical protein
MSISFALPKSATATSPTNATQRGAFEDELWSALRLDHRDSLAARTGLPIPHLSVRAKASSACYTVAAIDVGGRLADRSALLTLGWGPGQPVRASLIQDAVLVVPQQDSRHKITRQGRLRLPIALRRALRLNAGTRVLLAACADRQLLLIYPPAVLDSMILTYHAPASAPEER